MLKRNSSVRAASRPKGNTGRPKKKNAKRRSVYFDETLWGKLKVYACFRKTSISRVLEKAALNYLENRRLFGPPDA